MCTDVTEQRAITGSGKAGSGWFPLHTVTAYYDHPVHAAEEHTLNIDFANPSRGAAARVAVELPAEAALQLLGAVATVLARVPSELTGVSEARRLLAVVRDLDGEAAAVTARQPDGRPAP
jgi:Family of unknown function (DUF6295)